ncbi:MAG: O-antigen ligase family protein [Sphingomonadaceae bacterium]|nr:O-antigen ligase family protein [Sphingomonadaceae bacterium]
MRSHLFLISASGAVMFFPLSHLLPLPPSLWQLHPVYTDIEPIKALLDVDKEWRPWTVSYTGGFQTAVSFATPLAVLLFCIQLQEEDRMRLLPLVIGLSTISGLIGLLQTLGDPIGPLYIYRITNEGSAVGLFANRNHAATLLACLFPMLAVYPFLTRGSGNDKRRRLLWSFVISLVLVPLILITGSRSGLVIAIIGLVGGALLYGQQDHERRILDRSTAKMAVVRLAAGVTIFGLGIITVILSRAEAVERFWMQDGGDNRADFLAVSSDMFSRYFPLGSGSGSFVEMYQFSEPARLLDPTYLNRAHNDWAEILVTLGIPGLAIILSAIGTYCWRTYHIWRHGGASRRPTVLARMAGVTIGMISLASFFDYPLRTPIMLSIFVIFLLWFVGEQAPTPEPAS